MQIKFKDQRHRTDFQSFVCKYRHIIIVFLEIGSFSKKFLVRFIFKKAIKFVNSIECPGSFSRDSDIGAGGIPPAGIDIGAGGIPPAKP